MKKSFMTRVLAMGLSFAMAFSLSAATNVTTASAAAKKVGVTTMMKVPTKSVVEGKTVKTYMNGTALEKYRIKKVAKLSAVADKYIDVDVITTGKRPRQGIKITAHEGAVTAAKLTKKGVYVTIYFAETTSAKKAAKATAKKYAKLKVAVQAKPVEKLTMTAAATKVKQITVTFNKAVDTTTTKLVVKKGSATPTITPTFAADGKSATIAMGTKLTEGTYTVEATVGEEKLTADIAVQNEKLDKFALVGNAVVANPQDKTKGTISYKALNQYGEMMPVDTVNATCTLGKEDDHKTPTADKAGVLSIKEIPEILTVPGTAGKITIVDTSTGVQLNEDITYQTKAVAAKATVYGIYDEKNEKLMDRNLHTNEKVTNYWLLMNIQNQYEADMSVDDIMKSECDVDYNVASVITELTLMDSEISKDSAGTAKDINYDGKSCILVKIGVTYGGAKHDNLTIGSAGTMSMTIVSGQRGVIASPSFTVDSEVMIESFTASAKTSIYGGKDNELVVDAIDSNGNAVTKYETLRKAVQWDTAGIKLKKNADGTGTFYYNPGNIAATSDKKYKDTDSCTLVFKINEPTSGKYLIKSFTMTAYANPDAWKVAGTTADTITAAAKKEALVLKLKTLKFEDQYSNELDYKAGEVDLSKVSAWIVDKNDAFGYGSQGATGQALSSEITGSDADVKITLRGGASYVTKGAATLYLRYKNKEAIDKKDKDGTYNDEASADDYDIKLTISRMDTQMVSADDLKVTVNNGNAIYAVTGSTLTPATENGTAPATKDSLDTFSVPVVVTGKLGGKTVVIPTSDWTIVSGLTVGKFGLVSSTNPAKTEEKTVSVVVQTDNGPQTVSTKITLSNANPTAQKIKAIDGRDTNIVNATSNAAIVAADFAGIVEVKDQYGNNLDKASDMQYNITFTGEGADVLQEKNVTKNNTQDIVVKLPSRGEKYTASMTYKLGDLEFTQDILIKVTNS